MVVRRVLPGEAGPSGGPAMTDVLGTCTAWEEGACVVAPEHGPPVRIALADIVSGKPVPPRPSVRHRVTAREAEGRSLVMWPGLETEDLGAWVLRTEPRPEGRLRKRANSALALGAPGVPLPEAAQRVEAFYRVRRRDPLVQLEAGSAADDWFAAAGWAEVDGGASVMLLGSLARALRAAGASEQPAPEVTLHEDGPRTLAEAYGPGGDVLARGRSALDDDWLGLHDLVVDPAHRRRGLALALLRELLDHGAAAGATTAWLHVETGNDAALALYERLGLRVHHELRYRIAPTLRSTSPDSGAQ